MIHFFTKDDHRYTVAALRQALPTVQVSSYETVLKGRKVGPGSYVFTDIDRLSFGEHLRAADMYQALRKMPGCRVFNDPARVKTRYALLRALYQSGHNSFNAYRVDECVQPQRFPVFVRHEREHGNPLSELLPTQADLDRTLKDLVARGTPESTLLVVEYRAEPVAAGLFRKIAAYRIGDRIVPGNTVHDTQWCVKYGKHGQGTEALYQDEADILSTNRYASALMPVFEIANIEYGRADFGIVDGRVEVYEINTNPNIQAPGDHPSAIRMRSQRRVWKRLLEAVTVLGQRPG